MKRGCEAVFFLLKSLCLYWTIMTITCGYFIGLLWPRGNIVDEKKTVKCNITIRTWQWHRHAKRYFYEGEDLKHLVWRFKMVTIITCLHQSFKQGFLEMCPSYLASICRLTCMTKSRMRWQTALITAEKCIQQSCNTNAKVSSPKTKWKSAHAWWSFSCHESPSLDRSSAFTVKATMSTCREVVGVAPAHKSGCGV